MKFPRRCFVAWSLVCLAAFGRAEEFAWLGHGTIVVDVPAKWTLRGAPAGDVGYNFRGDTTGKSAAVLQITLVGLPGDQAAPDKEEAKDRLEKMVASTLPDSVEKIFTPVALKLRQGHGWYVQLTDPSLVGKPPEPENFKVMRNAFASLDAHTLAVITMQFDDPASAAPAEMLRLVESMSIKLPSEQARPDALSVRRTDGFYELNVPVSRLILKIPAPGLAEQKERTGGATANPRYFYLKNTGTGLQISGWVEQSSGYSDLLSFWKNESASMKRGGNLEPTHVRYGKIGNWETVEYDLPVSSGSSAHLRAELSQAGTWIDLHASLTGDRPDTELHTELRAFIESLVAETKYDGAGSGFERG